MNFLLLPHLTYQDLLRLRLVNREWGQLIKIQKVLGCIRKRDISDRDFIISILDVNIWFCLRMIRYYKKVGTIDKLAIIVGYPGAIIEGADHVIGKYRICEQNEEKREWLIRFLS